jgi:hypothetical protein
MLALIALSLSGAIAEKSGTSDPPPRPEDLALVPPIDWVIGGRVIILPPLDPKELYGVICGLLIVPFFKYALEFIN